MGQNSFLGNMLGYKDADPGPPNIPVPGKLPDISAGDWQKVAAQTRNLNPDEKDLISKIFGSSINPRDLRAGYDSSAVGTNLEGWVQPDKFPTVMFFQPQRPTDGSRIASSPSTFIHEAAHTWQNEAQGRYTNSDNDDLGYEYNKSKPPSFPSAGHEQQARMVEEGVPQATSFIRSHPINPNPRGDVAFLDSVRQRAGRPDDDSAARLGSIEGVGKIDRMRFTYKNPFEK